MPQLEYVCSCTRFCHGIERIVSRSTHSRHRIARTYDNLTADLRNGLINEEEFANALAGHGIDVHAALPSDSEEDISMDNDDDEHEQLEPQPELLRASADEDMIMRSYTAENGSDHGADDGEADSDFRHESSPPPNHNLHSPPPDFDMTDARLEADENRQDEDEIRNGGGAFDFHHLPDVEADQEPAEDEPEPEIEELRDALSFVNMLKAATLDKEPLDEEVIHALRDEPARGPFELTFSEHYCISAFLSSENASDDNYRAQIANGARLAAILSANLSRSMQVPLPDPTPDTSFDPMSLYRVKRHVRALTGIVPVYTDMCDSACVAFTGPYADLEACPTCGLSRYRTRTLSDGTEITDGPQKQMLSLPIGPQLQAMFRSKECAKAMEYRLRLTEEMLEDERAGRPFTYKDVFSGSDYLSRVKSGEIKDDDLVLMGSLDGAQLYSSKTSDCWFLIWVNMDLDPRVRYKKKYVMIGAIIPGPTKPKHIYSFLFTPLHHLIALQKEGLLVWNAHLHRIVHKGLYFFLELGDGPGITVQNGTVPHHGGKGCRTYCLIPGRRKPRATHYYPALLRPSPPYNLEGSNHDDINILTLPTPSVELYRENLRRLLMASTQAEYTRLRLETGIVKPSIFDALPYGRALPVPICFGLDGAMHLLAINIPDLLIKLWRGKLDCHHPDSVDDWPWAALRDEEVWKAYGELVADARPYFPGSFDCTPRNIAEKISSGYKAWEHMLHLYGLAPALLYNRLHLRYWQHFCYLVSAARIFLQHEIKQDELLFAHNNALQFVSQFEMLYYDRRPERIHFVRQCIHALTHLGPECVRVGPGPYTSQWFLERMIGLLGAQIKQHSTYFANLCQRAERQATINALKEMFGFDPDNLDANHGAGQLPKTAKALGDGYALLRARDEYKYTFEGKAAATITDYLNSHGAPQVLDPLYEPSFFRWARMRLPNGQVARSLWKESERDQGRIRRARNVKFLNDEGKEEIAEVQAYFRATVEMPVNEDEDEPQLTALALISRYINLDLELLHLSFGTLYVASYVGEDALQVIPAKWIKSVVAMIPFQHTGDNGNRYFLVEKPGLDMLFRALSLEEQFDIEGNDDT